MSDTVVVLGRDVNGIAVAELRDAGFTMRYYLTECCGASAKGSVAGGYPATVCRACYEVIDDAMGGEPMPLAEVFGDGIPYDVWMARTAPPCQNVSRAGTREVPPLSEYVIDDSRLDGFGAL